MSYCVTFKRTGNVCLLEYAERNRHEGFFNDLTVIADDEMIPVNRLVLCCHSKYFEKMFKSILRYENIIEIRAVDGPSAKTLIDFMYNGSITITDQNVFKLLRGAEYFRLEEVKDFCFQFLASNVRVDNSVDILKASTLYKYDALRAEAQEYISTKFDEVAKTDEFKALSKEDIIFCISNLDPLRTSETSIFQAIVTWTQYNKTSRASEFYELFDMINLSKINIDFLENVVLEEELVSSNLKCQKKAFLTFREFVRAEKFEPYESHLISLGGTNTRQKVSVVFSLSQETKRINYANFVVGIYCHCSVRLDNYVYSIGGRIIRGENFKTTNEVVKFNLKQKTKTWEKVASMTTKRWSMGACVFRGTLFVAGGADENDNEIASSECYVPAIDKWFAGSLMIQRRFGNALVSCDGYLYALGGWGDCKCLSSVERLEEFNGKWKNIQPMQEARKWLAAVNCNGVVYAIGGRTNSVDFVALNTVEKYDSASNKWKYVDDMKIARWAHAACVLRGNIYVVGGIDGEGNAVKEIERYAPLTDTWTVVGNVSDKVHQHTLLAV